MGGLSVRRLRHRCDLEKLPDISNDTPDAAGALSTDDSDWAAYRRNVPCNVESGILEGSLSIGGGVETEYGSQQRSIARVAVEMRHPRQGRFPKAMDRVKFIEEGTARYLNVVFVERDGRHRRRIVLHCKEADE